MKGLCRHSRLILSAALWLAACAAAPLPDLGGPAPGPAPALLPTARLLTGLTAPAIGPADAGALAVRAEALQARGDRLAARPVSGPDLPP